MGTQRPSWSGFDTVPSVNTSDRKLQSGGKIARDPSPRPPRAVQLERAREEEWRRERRRETKERYKDPSERKRYYDKERRPKNSKDEERERRQESRNVRPLSNIEMENAKVGDRGVRKGDTFPRSAGGHGPIMLAVAMEAEREERRRRREESDRERDREKVRERDRERDRERERPKDREDYRRKDERKEARDERTRDRYREYDDRRRGMDGEERRDKYAPRKNDKQRDEMRLRDPRMSSPERRRDRDTYWDKAQRREGRRDTRSEGEIDERERRRERGRERDEVMHQHSRSEGEVRGKRERDYRDQDRYREKEDRPRNRDDRYREERETERRTRPDAANDRQRRRSLDGKRREERNRDNEDYKRERRSSRERTREPDISSQSQSRTMPNPVISRHEWSSDKSKEEMEQLEQSVREKKKKENRKMWLEPRGPASKDSTSLREDREVVERYTGEETEELSVDGELEEIWANRPRSFTGNSEENTEESEEGSDVAWTLDRDRILSGEDGFVTVSSGEDGEEREEEFKDCMEYWVGERDANQAWTKEESTDDSSDTQGTDTPPKFVFCVIGQPDDELTKEVTPAQNKLEHEYDEVRETLEERNISNEQTPLDGIKFRSNSFNEFGTIKRDSQTEKLLLEWRENNSDQKEDEEERLSLIPSNPYADVPIQLPYEQVQSGLEKSGTLTPEEEEAIRIRLSGAWTMSEEPKRHSQAPHLKWATSVVREILGQSDENIDDIEEREKEKQDGGMQIPVIRADDELEMEEESLEMEGLRDDEDGRSKSWGELDLRHVLDNIGKRKRNSKFFKAAQLYQQYSEAAQNFEILRQARSDVVSVCEGHSPPGTSPLPARRPLPPLPNVPHPHSLSNTGSVSSVQNLPLPQPPGHAQRRASSPRLSISLGQSATLWRDLPAVRTDAELQELTEDQRRLQEVRFEVVTSEASYCRSLDIVVEHFVKSKQLGALLTTQDRNWLFSRLSDVRAISHSFLSKLEEKVESDIMHFTVCDVIARHCQRFKMVYVPYLTNQSYQDKTYQRLMNENPGFRRVVEKLERNPVCQRLPLRSFLVLPFQRITRIKLLVQNIVKRTTPGTPQAIQAIKALKLLEKLIQESNDSITQMKSIESLVSLSAKVDFECKTLPLVSQSRILVREGKVTELMDFSVKEQERSLYLHLFNDHLLVSQQKEGGRFTVIDTCPVSELRVENFRIKLHSLQKNVFRLHTSHKSLLLRTDTQSDKLRWISALSRPHPEVDFSTAQDFAQMQCIRGFVSQQPDELSLEKADIILVHQQSSDHWVEGTRLSDRQRGWIPESHLDTISILEIRQRNLSDALKLTTATAQV
ncbi:trichohyalin isoform X2 [Periophthalmus magnuspinnatus]|uniref:trichohyalin isoform X2 n=1 Tax=Periophthalmus magnuspinnatus TaxID=409849 RepID=UPI00243726C7|nr:trichohyalin isoform X2 [Periophthalmus magnuspinnatus]